MCKADALLQATQETDEGCKVYTAVHAILEGDADDDGADLANSEHLLPDDEEEESIFLASTKLSSQTKCCL